MSAHDRDGALPDIVPAHGSSYLVHSAAQRIRLNDVMKLTLGSITTKIAWMSTCLLTGGASTLFSENVRDVWLLWGCFGLAASVGLDVVARARDRVRMDGLKQIATRRFDREMTFTTEENVAIALIGETVARILGRNPQTQNYQACRRIQERYPCDLNVEILVQQSAKGPIGAYVTCTHAARLTNVSNFGFELTTNESLPRQRVVMFVTTVSGGRETMLGEILWSEPKSDGSLQLAGGRFLNAMTVEDNEASLAAQPHR
jgi:hypothetical protein